VYKDDQETGTQCHNLSQTRIETIEELLRQRGFFDTLGRDEVKSEKDEAVLVQ
jgi:hypothetical protein